MTMNTLNITKLVAVCTTLLLAETALAQRTAPRPTVNWQQAMATARYHKMVGHMRSAGRLARSPRAQKWQVIHELMFAKDIARSNPVLRERMKRYDRSMMRVFTRHNTRRYAHFVHEATEAARRGNVGGIVINLQRAGSIRPVPSKTTRRVIQIGESAGIPNGRIMP
jgi:hypothetical protein